MRWNPQKKNIKFADNIQLVKELSIIWKGGGGVKALDVGVSIHCNFLCINHKKSILG
jgi:hypothetical protein